MGGGHSPRYPTHVWSPAGGWNSQPANWKGNTFVLGAVGLGIAASFFALSANREYRSKFPEEGRFFPSRWWSKQIIEHEKESAASKAS